MNAQVPDERGVSLEAAAEAGRKVQTRLLVAMVVWGLNLPAVKALTQWYRPLTLASGRMVVATAVLTLLVAWRRRGGPALGRNDLAILVICGVLMVYCNQVFFAEGILRSTATNAALITALSPLFSVVLVALAFREPLTLPRAAGLALGFAGVAAVVLSHSTAGLGRAGVGDLMLVGGVVSFAAGGVLVQRLSRGIDPLVISWAVHAIGTLLLVMQTLATEPPASVAELFPAWQPVALVLFSGALATAMCNAIWNGAIARIGVARTSVFFYWVPVFGVGFSALLLGETLGAWHLAGALAVLAGTFIGTRTALRAQRSSIQEE